MGQIKKLMTSSCDWRMAPDAMDRAFEIYDIYNE